MICSKCRKELNDFKIDIAFSIKVNRMKNDSEWEPIPNLDNTSKETLCYECFDDFSQALSQLNK